MKVIGRGVKSTFKTFKTFSFGEKADTVSAAVAVLAEEDADFRGFSGLTLFTPQPHTDNRRLEFL